MTDSENNYLGHQDDSFDEDFLVDMPGRQDKVTVERHEQKRVHLSKRDNNSGMGEQAPYSISKKFNWGACLWGWIWGIRYKKWALLIIPALLLVPYGIVVCVIMSLWAGINGNQWAWEEIEYKDEKDFHEVQQQWVKVWGVFAFIVCVLLAPLIIDFIKRPDEVDFSLENHQLLSTLELTIPDEYFEQTDRSDNHFDITNSNKYVVYWLRPENTLSLKNKKYIENSFEKNKSRLNDRFILYPDIKRLSDSSANLRTLELEAKCKNEVCIDTWLYEKCNKGYCIINPRAKKYYKIRTKENVIPKMRSLLNKW